MNRLCVHTITTKPLSIEECLIEYPDKGIQGISVWRQAIEGRNLQQLKQSIADSGLTVVSLCRGGFFPAPTAQLRKQAIDDNLRAIEQAHAIGAPLIVLVCGAVPGQDLATSRAQIAEGISAVLPAAEQAGIKLAIEPLHPMYADDRSAINTIRQANEICDRLGSPGSLGIAVDVYHVWWDSELEYQIELTGQHNRLFAFHICDWLTPTTDLLNDRGLMGDGCINISQISRWVDQTGFSGWREVEIFSDRWWKQNQSDWLRQIKLRYQHLYQETDSWKPDV